MVGRSSTNRWLIVALSGVGLAIGAWFALGPEQRSPDPRSGATGLPVNDSSLASSDANNSSEVSDMSLGGPLDLPTSDHRISESGRLMIEAETLREGDVLTLGLALADAARGDEPLAVRVVSVDGRVLDITAVPMDGKGSGVRLAIDADWLWPGNYMIQVKTIEQTQFPLRRYVLEVR